MKSSDFTGGRQPNAANPARARPFSIRLTPAELASLRQRAGRKPLGAFIRARLLGEAARTREERLSPAKDAVALARVLAALGQSGIAKSLNELAQQAAIGALYLDAGTTAKLRQASDDVIAMRLMLLEALGKEVERRTSDRRIPKAPVQKAPAKSPATRVSAPPKALEKIPGLVGPVSLNTSFNNAGKLWTWGK